MSDLLSYLEDLTGTASALTYGQFAAMEYTGIKPLGTRPSSATRNRSDTSALLFPELYLERSYNTTTHQLLRLVTCIMTR